MNTKNKSIKPEGLVAIIGMAGRFPKAKNLEEFWHNLKESKNCITYFSDKELHAAGIKDELLHNSNYIKAHGILDNIDLFDANFFNYSPKEAELMDPQHRLFLESAWEALETAGYIPDKYSGVIGVYTGMVDNSLALLKEQNDTYSLANFIATNYAFLSTKTSYKLNLTGPSLNINTACSTSLTSVILACQGLLNYDCDIALAGGAAIHLPQQQGYLYEEQGVMSKDGYCRAFDENATGFVPGSGIGIVVLKRLEDAINDNDTIDAVIKGFAVNNDGANKVGYTAPSISGQASCIATAQALANVDPATITYIEAHGTGTLLGDTVEIAALNQVFKATTNKKQFCAISSVKTNIGHADIASGISGLIKTILALKNKKIPASLNFKRANSKIDFKNSPFYVNTKLTNWISNSSPRRAGVSSFGMGGTNAHIVLEEAPDINSQKTVQKNFIITISAKTKTALFRIANNLHNYLEQNSQHFSDKNNFADLAFTLQVGRQDFRHRMVFMCQNIHEALTKLKNTDKKNITQIDIKSNLPPLNPINLTLQKTISAWLKGYPIQWEKLYAKEKRKRIHLPTYPFEGFSCKMVKNIINNTANESWEKWLYKPCWEKTLSLSKTPLHISDFTENYFWLIFANDDNLSQNIIKTLQKFNQKIIVIKKGDMFKKINDENYVINYHTKDGYNQIIDILPNTDTNTVKIIHLWNVPQQNKNTNSITDIKDIISLGFYSLLFIFQSCTKKYSNKHIDILIAATQIASVLKQDLPSPEKTTLLGATRVIPQEYANFSARVIDLEYREIERNSILLAQHLVKETLLINDNIYESEIAFRKNYRWLLKYIHLDTSSKTQVNRLRQNGVYLITGGTGSFGIITAKHIAKQTKGHIILTTRKKYPSENQWQKIITNTNWNDQLKDKIIQLMELRELCSSLSIVECDVSNETQVLNTIKALKKKFGSINGVIHAAGIPGIGIAQLKTQEEAEHVFQSKIYGTFILQKALQKETNLDFFIMYSSLSAIMGVLGHVDFAAATIYQNTIALNNIFPSKTLVNAINWSEWADSHGIGIEMISNQPPEFLAILAKTTILSRQALQILDWVISNNNKQITISKIDIHEQIQKFYDYRNSITTANNLQKNSPLDINQQLTKIWSNLLKIDKINTDDDFFSLGGHSLLAIKLVANIKDLFNVTIALQQIYELKTIKQQTDYIKAQTQISSQKSKSAFTTLQPKGNKKPIFFMHPSGGTIFAYLPLTKYINKDHPLYCIQNKSITAGKMLYSSAAEMAQDYILEMKKIQPHGPYLLGGASFGGNLAIEMAYQLKKQTHEDVPIIFLIDSWSIFSKEVFDYDRFAKINQGYHKELKQTLIDNNLTNFEFLVDMAWECQKLGPTFKPHKIPSKIILFKSKETSPEYLPIEDKFNCWKGHSTKPIDVHLIPGNHSTMNLEPNVKTLAKKLNEYLEKFD